MEIIIRRQYHRLMEQQTSNQIILHHIIFIQNRPVNADYSSGAVGRNGATTVKIYGDGVLLYTAPNIDKNTTGPVKFDIDITGVSELKIVMMGTWFNGMYGYGGTLVCMSDVMLE